MPEVPGSILGGVTKMAPTVYEMETCRAAPSVATQ